MGGNYGLKRGVAIATVALAGSLAVAGPTGSAADPTAQSAAPVKVGMRDNFYKPAKVRVVAGGLVKWTNRGATEHSATKIGGGFDTGLLPPGGTAKRKFKRAGTFKYVCSVHPNMKGKVVVTG